MISSDGRVVMVSGANRGIGLAVVERLHDDGYLLSLGARNTEALEKATERLDAKRVLRSQFDATDRESHEGWVNSTAERFGRIDAIVNNAGITSDVTIEDDDEEAFDLLWEVNAKSPLRMIRLTLPYLKETGNGRIINVVSLSGKRVRNLYVAYNMSKFAAIGLTHSARRIGWEHGVRATAVCPAFVNTDLPGDSGNVSREDMTQPSDLAALISTLIALPNNAVVAELLVNYTLNETY